jgi:hypothetical protein
MRRFAPIVMPERGDRHRAERVIAIAEIRTRQVALVVELTARPTAKVVGVTSAAPKRAA